MDECAGRAIELPENPQLAHRHHRLPAADVDQDPLEHFVHVLRLAGQVLIVPFDLSGVRIECERGVGVERVTVGAADRAGPWLRLCGAPVDEVRVRVVAPGNPRVAARAPIQRQIAPGLAARLARPGHRRRAPRFFSAGGIVRADEADIVFVAAAAGHAGDHFSADDDRARRVAVSQLRVGHGHVPHAPPGPRVERDDVRVAGRSENPVAEDGEVPLDASEVDVAGAALRGAPGFVGAVLPDQIAGGSVERLNDAAGIRQIHDAVVDEGCRLLRARALHRPRPCELQLLDVPPGDLLERTVAPGIVGAPPVQPVAWRRIAEHGLGDRLEVADLRAEPERAGENSESD